MNSDYKNELEARIDHELKTLRPLHAPGSLAPRVMAEIERRAAVPWYRRAWQSWPVALQAASMVVLLLGFAILCFAGWELNHGASCAAVMREVGGWFAGLNMVWKTAAVLGEAGRLAVGQLGTGFIVAAVAAVALAYATMLALGTACARLALARR